MTHTVTTPALVVLLVAMFSAEVASFDSHDPDRPGALEYRLIGPAAGGRVSRVTGVPGDPLTYYAATAAGGVWKSTNGGLVWKPVFDDQPVSSTGSIAVAPSDPNVIYVGSGEANIRGNVAEGNGIYKSTDAGQSWIHVWKAEGQIGTMIVHPRDPDIAFAAVLGSPFGPGPERGVFRTTDGGQTWEKVLYRDPDTGASDVCFDPTNPRRMFAGLWQARRTSWDLTSGGPGSGLYLSQDGGTTWKRLEGDGLPEGIWGKVGVRVAPSDPRRVYALIEAEKGGLFRSDDGGKEWELVNPSRGLRQRAWYYTTLTVDPQHADVVWFPQVGMLKTIDGGQDVRSATGGGWDYHDVWIDPAQPKRMIVGSDAGVSLTWDGGETWVRPPLPISQFYHLSVDTRTPYRVLGTLQDRGTLSGPSNSLHAGGILLSDWYPVGGGEAGHVVAHPEDPRIVWAGEYLGFISRYDERTGRAPHVGIYPENGSGHPASDLRYRFQWTAPIVISPHDPQVVYHASNLLFRTRDDGQSWQAISPDLTRADETKQAWAGGPITGDNTGVEFYGTIFAVAESPLVEGLIWAGTDDGRVHVTRDRGGSWNDVTPGDLPEWGTVSTIEASRFNAGRAYLVVDAHRLDDESPYLWKTDDHGQSWARLTEGLDPEVYLHVVREDTIQRELLYLGTERGVMLSRDGGETWESLRLNLPTVAVVDLVVAGDDLVVGTLGRSAWILDDLTPVREMRPELATHLFPPRPVTRWHIRSSPPGHASFGEHATGANPPEGAIITYHLAKKPEGEITVEILDSNGSVVRRLRSEKEPAYTTPEHPDWDPEAKLKADLTVEPGLNRVSWNLRYAGPEWTPGARYDYGDPGDGPRVPPGEYTLRLTVDGETHEQTLEVRPDPRSPTDAAALAAQIAFLLEGQATMNEITRMVNRIRSIREQIGRHHTRLDASPDASELVETGNRIAADLGRMEAKLINPGAQVNYDVLAGREGGAQLYSRLQWLLRGGSDHPGPPTQGMREVYDEISAELARQRTQLENLISNDLTELNRRAAERGVPYVAVP